MCRPQHVLPSEIDMLPFRYLLFGKRRPDDAALSVYTNVVITDELQVVLDSFALEWQKGADKYTDPATTAGMLNLVDAAKVAFAKVPRRTATVKSDPGLGSWGAPKLVAPDPFSKDGFLFSKDGQKHLLEP